MSRVVTTFRAGRNEEKRVAREDSRKSRKEMVAVIADYRRKRYLSRMSAPKRHYSQQTIAMLSDRRLRQRGLACVLALCLMGSTVHVQTSPTWICPNGQSGIPPLCN